VTPPQPQGFRQPGQILSAHFSSPPALRRKRYTGRRAEGIRYERKGQEYLQDIYGWSYLSSPWLRFFADGEWRWCQPDGILFDFRAGLIHIVEFKYQHTTDAWWQTRHLYLPVLRAIFPEKLWRFQVCEVVKWYDPAVKLPEKMILANEVHIDSNFFKVHIWKP
jgi:hypothetical protein